jgi:hypothetical protein
MRTKKQTSRVIMIDMVPRSKAKVQKNKQAELL